MTCDHVWKVAQATAVRDARREAGKHDYLVWGGVYCTRCGASGEFSGKGVASNV